MSTTLINETDERIVLEPGESIRVREDKETYRSTVQVSTRHRIREVIDLGVSRVRETTEQVSGT